MSQSTTKKPHRRLRKQGRKTPTTYELDYKAELDAEHAEQLQNDQTDWLLHQQDQTELGSAVGTIFWIRHLDGECEAYCIYCIDHDDPDETEFVDDRPREEVHDAFDTQWYPNDIDDLFLFNER